MERAPAMVDDIIAAKLKVIFVGYNPGQASEQSGHHFAGPGNLFWALLFDSGLTPQRLTPEQDGWLLYWGLGITNLVSRMTRGSSDLDRREMLEGGEQLHAKLLTYRPEIAAFLGKDIYRSYRGLGTNAPIVWGLQSHVTVTGTRDFVAPNPSRRSTMAYADRLRYVSELHGLTRYGSG